MTKDELINHATKIARPSFCEIQLSKFIFRVTQEATSIEDVEKIFVEMRKPTKRQQPLRKV